VCFQKKSGSRLHPRAKSSTLNVLLAEIAHPHPLLTAPVEFQTLALEGWRMTRKSTLASLVVAVALSLGLTACKDTKTLQENEQLKAQIADLQKQNGQMGNNLETVTADRDARAKENEALKAQLHAAKPKTAKKKKVASRRRQRS
jgi:hypothetical protein